MISSMSLHMYRALLCYSSVTTGHIPKSTVLVSGGGKEGFSNFFEFEQSSGALCNYNTSSFQ